MLGGEEVSGSLGSGMEDNHAKNGLGLVFISVTLSHAAKCSAPTVVRINLEHNLACLQFDEALLLKC